MQEIKIHKKTKKEILFLFILSFLFYYPSKTQYLSTYPKTNADSTQDVYFGRTISDPYRWLENTQDSNVVDWVHLQNNYAEHYFSNIPYYPKIEKNIQDNSGFQIDFPASSDNYSLRLFSYGKESGKRDFKNYNPILYYRTKFENWKELINPLEFRKTPDENVIITNYLLSPDDKFLCFNISRNGSDWNEIMTLDMRSKKIIGEPVKWVKFSDIMWYKNGFFYERFDSPTEGKDYVEQNANYSLCYHKIKETQNTDLKVAIENFSDAELIDQDKLVIYHVLIKNSKEYNVVSVLKLNEESVTGNVIKPFIVYPVKKDYAVNVIHFKNDSAIVRTNLHADKGLLALYSTNELNRFDTLIKEYSEVLTRAFYYRGKINCLYEKDSRFTLVRFNMHGERERVHIFPAFSTIQLNIPKNEKEIYYFETSFDRPKILYKFYFETYTSSLVKPTEVHYEPREYETKWIEYTASDGVKIPMTLFYKKGTLLNGHNPVLLTAYGGYGIITRPTYDFTNLLWAENNGIYVVAHIRGGGEKGKKWHFAGSGLNKQKSIDDFIDAAKFLINNNYTTKDNLVSTGASNGGMLVAGAAMREPGLFKAVVSCVGVYDMLRYQHFTIGNHWREEYGLSSDSLEFGSLINYSPLHTVSDTISYPGMLIITGDHDDRVPPFHSYKYAARLQQNRKKNNPVLLYVEKNSGHSGWVNGSNRYKEDALMMSFLFYSLGIEPKLID